MPIFTFSPPAPAQPSAAALQAAEAMTELVHDTGIGNHRRDRLLSALVLLCGMGLLLGAPFALAGAASFLIPVVTAIVVSIILVPALSWLMRRGVPAMPAALAVLLAFIAVAFVVLTSIVIPALAFIQLLPTRLQQIRANLKPLLKTYTMVQHALDQVNHLLGIRGGVSGLANQVPGFVLGFVSSAPLALIQTLFTLLLAFFFLNTYASVRSHATQEHTRRTLGVSRLLRDVVRNTASYFFTITIVNVGLGTALALVAWGFGLPTPLMWGGLAALFNFFPYIGPLGVAVLLLVGGLVTFAAPINALWPALIFLGFHLTEANFITPSIIGKRLTISPLAILLSLSFWGWVWGVLGALISVPLLIMGKVMLDHAGTPDVLGFLFGEGTLAGNDPPTARPAPQPETPIDA